MKFKIEESPLFKNRTFRLRIIIIALGLSMAIVGHIAQYDYQPARWMTYRDFDVPGEKNFINYLSPGVKDSSSDLKYQFVHKHIILLLAVLFLFFPLMFFLRVFKSLDFKLGVYRYLTQWLTFLVARLGIFRVTGICPVKRSGLGVFPFINCQSCELATGACPLGTFQMSLLNKQIPFALIGQLLIVGLLSGRTVCGWLCPYGFLSDIFDKIKGKRIKVPLKFSLIKYGVLAGFLGSSLIYFFKDSSETLFYCSFICPAGFYYGVLEYALTTGVKSVISDLPFVHYMLVYHFAIGALVLVGSAKLGGRFFCKYACPLGAIYGLFNKIALFGIQTNNKKCKSGCGACEKVCPMDISILDESLLSRSNCIICGRCQKVCPTGKIEYRFSLFGSDKQAVKKAKPLDEAKTIKRKRSAAGVKAQP